MKIYNKIFSSIEDLERFLLKFNKNEFCFIQIFAGVYEKQVLRIIIKTLKEYFEKVEIIGLSSAAEIYNREILNEKILISFTFTNNPITVKEFDLLKISSEEIGKKVKSLISPSTSAMIIYADPYKFNPDEFLKKLNKSELKPPLFGALAADNGILPESMIISKNKIHKHAAIVALIENVSTFNFSILEYINAKAFFEINKYKKNKIYSINHKPASEFLKEYFGEKIENANIKSTFSIPIMFNNIPRSILKINKSHIVLLGNVLSKIASFGLPDVISFINKFQALKQIEAKEIKQGLLTFSYGKKLIMEEEIKKELRKLDIKMIGFVGYGEMFLKENKYIFVTNSLSLLALKSDKNFSFEDEVYFDDSEVTKHFLLKAAVKISSELNKKNLQVQKIISKKYEKLLKLQRLFYTQLNEIYTKETVALFSHQLRQPLNSIAIAMSNLSLNAKFNKLNPKEVEEISKFIQNQCINISQTINDFFPFDNKTKYIKISKILLKISKILSIQLYNRKIDFKIETKDDFYISGNISLFYSALIGIIFYLRDEIQNKKEKKITITTENNSIIITTSTLPNLKNILSLRSKDIRMLVAKNILTQEFNISFKLKTQPDSLIIILKKSKK